MSLTGSSMTCPGVGNILGPERQSSVRPPAATGYGGAEEAAEGREVEKGRAEGSRPIETEHPQTAGKAQSCFCSLDHPECP